MKRFILAITFAAISGPGMLPAAAEAPKAAGTVIGASGKVTLISAKNAGGSLKAGQPVFAGDRIKTGANGRAQIVLSDGTQLKVNYLTDITLRDHDAKGKISARGIGSIKIALGELWARVTKKDSKMEFETPAAVAAVKGTNPLFNVDADGNLCLRLLEGKVLMDAGSCTQELNANEMMCIKPGQKACEAKVSKLDSAKSFADDKGPESADVTLKVKDKDGVDRKIKVHYKKN